MSSVSATWARALSYTKGAANLTLPGMIDGLAETFGAKVALIETWGDRPVRYEASYIALARRVNRYARWGLTQGFGKGDTICLMMQNRIDYVAVWLGLTRIGCTVALLNTNLRGDALRHCIQVAKSDTAIISDGFPFDYVHFVPDVKRLLRWDDIRTERDGLSPEPLDLPFPKPDDRALLIYTSGTTGMPKATNITHRRIVEWSFWFAGMMDVQPTDCLYNCLPMYHSIGGVVAIGAMLVKGGSVFIREKFSASRFWDEIAIGGCTIFQYIGELCRYLTLSEPHPKEREHKLRLACGNGLQGDVWAAFQERFSIPQVLEFYAATEGNLSLYNVEGKPGAVGRIPVFLSQHFAVKLIQCDPETGEPTRDADGFCLPCAVDQPGEAISQIGHRHFDGYTDPEASKRKILRNVFTEGDRWFRSGDLMRKDASGYFYFLDRLGDTFRWKGENVSTTEVAAVLRGVEGVIDAVVYGVQIPGVEGRAGMAALTTTHAFRFTGLSEHLAAQLPEYARPVYVRLCQSLNTTGTFKLTKTDLIREGIETTDELWQRDQATGHFMRIDWGDIFN